MPNTDPQRSPKLPGNESQVRNIVIYSLNARLIERRDRLARYGVGLLNLPKRVWRSDALVGSNPTPGATISEKTLLHRRTGRYHHRKIHRRFSKEIVQNPP